MLKDLLFGGGFIALVYVGYRLSKSFLGGVEGAAVADATKAANTVETAAKSAAATVTTDATNLVNGVKKDL